MDIDWLIDYVVFYSVSSVFQQFDGGDSFVHSQNNNKSID